MNFDLIVRRMMGYLFYLFSYLFLPMCILFLSFGRYSYQWTNGRDSTLIQFTVTCYLSTVSLTCDTTYVEAA
jgi:hypothetical protein